jgi:hypothetical protein
MPAQRSPGADLLLGAGLCLVCLLALLFATGEDTSFIYIDF